MSPRERIYYRFNFFNAEGEKISGPVMEAPEGAVEPAEVEAWLVPETECKNDAPEQEGTT